MQDFDENEEEIVTEDDLMDLALLIKQKIIKEVEEKHLSGNLVESIVVSNFQDKICIDIPAETYDMYRYMDDKVIIPTGKGSYAAHLNVEGSPWENHKGFAERVVKEGIKEWLNQKRLKGRVTTHGNK